MNRLNSPTPCDRIVPRIDVDMHLPNLATTPDDPLAHYSAAIRLHLEHSASPLLCKCSACPQNNEGICPGQIRNIDLPRGGTPILSSETIQDAFKDAPLIELFDSSTPSTDRGPLLTSSTPLPITGNGPRILNPNS